MFVLSVETEAAIRNDFIVKKQKLWDIDSCSLWRRGL
jgi:hypothetical protein